MMADDSFGVEIVEDGNGGSYEYKDSFEGSSPDDVVVVESPFKKKPSNNIGRGGAGEGGAQPGGKNHFLKGRFSRGGQTENSNTNTKSNDLPFNAPVANVDLDGWHGDRSLGDDNDADAASDLPHQVSGLTQGAYLSLEDTASQDESFNTSTRRLGGEQNGNGPNPKRSSFFGKRASTTVSASPKKKLSPVDEDQKRKSRKRAIVIALLFLLVLALSWFMVYWFTSGEQKATLRRSASIDSMSPSVSPSPTTTPTASPSGSPSEAPSAATASPTNSPTDGPTDTPTLSMTPTSVGDVIDPVTVVSMAERDIRTLINNDPLMGPKFVRLAFHDCVGFCDGCVDMTFGDNFGLDLPIDALTPIVEKYERPDLGISRADIWALAALVATDIAQERSDTKVDFRMMFIGRKNCEIRTFNRCFAEDGVTERECSPKLGPFHHLPLADITTADLFHFFNKEFGFNDKETVAIMGAHTLGALHEEFSGIDGENGWVRDNLLLDNDYYVEIVGGESIDDDLENIIENSPPWLRVMEENEEGSGFPDKPVWEAFPRSLEDPDQVERLVMLNADVSVFSLSKFVCTCRPTVWVKGNDLLNSSQIDTTRFTHPFYLLSRFGRPLLINYSIDRNCQGTERNQP
jgi:hypothetical protein